MRRDADTVRNISSDDDVRCTPSISRSLSLLGLSLWHSSFVCWQCWAMAFVRVLVL